MNNDRENEGLKKTWPARAAKWSGYTLAGILGASTIIDGILVTPESQRKVITTGGQFSRIQGPGFGLKIPFLQGSTSLPIKMVELHTKPTNTATQDNQTLENVQTVIQYTLHADKLKEIYAHFPDYESQLENMANSAQKGALGAVNTSTLAENRGRVEQEMMDRLNASVKTSGMPLNVLKVVLTDFQWDPKFAASVQENMKAKNEAKRAEYVLEQTKLEAQQVTAKALGEAEANRARANGEKDAMIARADGKAYEITKEGEAKATALKVQISAVGNPQTLVDLTKAQNWTGNVPAVVSGNDGNGMFIDLRGAQALGAELRHDSKVPTPKP